ncbi:ferrous iron transport protein A [Leptolyngbya sp. 'hensonii']|uniref:FeoA family protein n=1 Tax=Leptolyngbya sp. 'hensonii' TaxID=1922337 RepID=UPI00094F79B1|nr:ferrous iron transport protein A [Leptolyngbya sp. 'hensonii']OLP17709.1 ferrous iron transport protein A [Leptolyngbya sp. 'hensonii']
MPKPYPHLAVLKPGQVAIISKLNTSHGLHQRLLALGFRSGRQITMLRRSWFSGPLHVRIGTTEVMLRQRDAQKVEITPLVTGETS